MFLRTFYGLVLLIFTAASLHAQDVVIYSKDSEDVTKFLQGAVEKLEEKIILKSYKLLSVNSQTSASTDLTGKSFEVDESLKAKSEEIADKIMAAFTEKAKALDKKDLVAGMDALHKKSIEDLEEELSKLKANGLAPLNAAVQSLSDELKSNEEKSKKLTDSEPADTDQIVTTLLNTLKESNENAVISSKGKPETEIKKAAEALTHKQSEEKYPFPKKADVELEAAKKYPKYQVGDNVTVVFYPTPNRPQTKSGPIKLISKDRIQISFTKILINDIKDPIMRDGMRPEVTDKNRKDYVDEVFAEIRKKRTKFFNDNLQPNADAIIAENIKNGFILAGGKWQSSSAYTNSLLAKKLADWKKEKLNLLEKAILADKATKDAVEEDRAGYNAPANEVLEAFKNKIDGNAKQIIAEMNLKDDKGNFSEEDFEKFEAARIAEEKRKKEEADKLAAKNKKQQQAIKDKERMNQEMNTAPEEGGSGQMIMIGAVLLIVGGIAFVFFNPKLRAKLIPGSGKKKSMQDVVSNLAPPGADTPLPMPGGPAPGVPGGPAGVAPPPGIPAGMGAPAGGMDTEKTKIDLDDDVSIVRRDEEEAPQAAPRKKISLNLGSSTTSLSNDTAPPSEAGSTQNSIDPGSIGGLTPPGGGLKPPGGGLTPPGGGLTPPGGGLTPPGGGLKPPGGGLTPPGGGLTPPGGGLTPPGGGLKPPGGDLQAPGSDDSGGNSGTEDKSNLILNPNLDGSGSKLRLKK